MLGQKGPILALPAALVWYWSTLQLVNSGWTIPTCELRRISAQWFDWLDIQTSIPRKNRGNIVALGFKTVNPKKQKPTSLPMFLALDHFFTESVVSLNCLASSDGENPFLDVCTSKTRLFVDKLVSVCTYLPSLLLLSVREANYCRHFTQEVNLCRGLVGQPPQTNLKLWERTCSQRQRKQAWGLSAGKATPNLPKNLGKGHSSQKKPLGQTN